MKKLNLGAFLLISSLFLLAVPGYGADKDREDVERIKFLKLDSGAEKRAKLVKKLAARALAARERARDSNQPAHHRLLHP